MEDAHEWPARVTTYIDWDLAVALDQLSEEVEGGHEPYEVMVGQGDYGWRVIALWPTVANEKSLATARAEIRTLLAPLLDYWKSDAPTGAQRAAADLAVEELAQRLAGK